MPRHHAEFGRRLLQVLFLVLLACSPVRIAHASADVDNTGGGAAPLETAPPTAQWNLIGTSGPASGVTGDSRLTRVVLAEGERMACLKRIDVGNAAGVIVCRFNLSVAGASRGAVTTQVFRVGSSFSGSTGDESNATTYARLGLTGLESGDGFRLNDLVADRHTAGFTGTQAITWALNNSGGALSYAAPNGTTVSIANDRMDVWVGRTRVFDDAAVTSPDASVAELKWLWNSGAGLTTFGLLEAHTLDEPSASGAPASAVDAATVAAAPTAVTGGQVVELYRPWPNPSRDFIRYAYAIAGGAERVDIGVFDVAGRSVRSLVRGVQNTGRYEVMWDGLSNGGTHVRGGMYFLRATIGSSSRVTPVIRLN